jgi:hypothetical protein
VPLTGYMTTMLRWVSHILALAAMAALPIAAIFTGGAKLVPFLAMPLVVLGGPMIMRARASSESDPEADADDDDSDSDDGGGGNRRPDHGPGTPSGPMGELPLEFSRPAGYRMRGNGRQRAIDPGRRRHPHQPQRTPHRVPAGPRRH